MPGNAGSESLYTIPGSVRTVMVPNNENGLKMFGIEVDYQLDSCFKFHAEYVDQYGFIQNRILNITLRELIFQMNKVQIPFNIQTVKLLNLIPEETLKLEDRQTISLAGEYPENYALSYNFIATIIHSMNLENDSIAKLSRGSELIVVYAHGGDGRSVGLQTFNSKIMVRKPENSDYEVPITLKEYCRICYTGNPVLMEEEISQRFSLDPEAVSTGDTDADLNALLKNLFPEETYKRQTQTASSLFTAWTNINSILKFISENHKSSAGILLANCNLKVKIRGIPINFSIPIFWIKGKASSVPSENEEKNIPKVFFPFRYIFRRWIFEQ